MVRRNPMLRPTLGATLAAIRLEGVPDIRTFLPQCPEAIAVFFRDALSPNILRRPSTAKAMRERLEACSRMLVR